ncbi:MAG: enoyl-CoA hydratase/isomerase family protein [Marmoricola sp.]
MGNAEKVKVERIPVDERGSMLGLVTLNRPDEMNPFDWDTGIRVRELFKELAEDDVVRVVAVTGSGKAFSAGGDMEKYRDLQRDPVGFPQFLEDMHAGFTMISEQPKPFIALVNGVSVAGGTELILSCDFAIAARSARIGDAHLPFGQMGGGGVLTLLPRAIGPARARELIFSGRLLSADEALEWGLVTKVVDDDQLLQAGIAFAAEVAKKSPLAIANAKRVLNAALWNGTGVYEGLRLEREVTARYCLTSEDAPEGLEAFAAKRPPQFVGR